MLGHILNQNAQAEGLFYIHPDAAVRISQPSVAVLQVSVALRAKEHYKTLIAARTGGLREPFQSKLGWLIGNLFARVATQDVDPSTRRQLQRDLLEPAEGLAENSPRWVSKQRVELVKRARVNIGGMTRDQIGKVLDQHKPIPPMQVALERVIVVVRESVAGVTPAHLEAVRARLATDAVFESACKP